MKAATTAGLILEVFLNAFMKALDGGYLSLVLGLGLLRRLGTGELPRGSWRVSPPEIGLAKLVGDISKVLHHPALTLL